MSTAEVRTDPRVTRSLRRLAAESVLLAVLFAACVTVDPSLGAGGTDTVLNFPRGRSATVEGSGAAVAPTTFDASSDRVWKALLDALTALGLPVDVLSEQSLTAGTAATSARARFAGQRLSSLIACGGSAGVVDIADSYAVTIGVLANLVPEGSSTTLHVRVAGAAKDPFTSVPARHCITRGRLEAQVDSTVRAMLAAGDASR